MSARRRPAAHAAGAVVTFLVVGVAAVVGVVWFLGAQAPVRITQGCTAVLDGREHGLSTVEAGNAALITGISVQRGLPARAATIGLATAMQESRLVNIDYGDRDSLGLFQQRPSQGWGTPAEIMDPVYSTNAFYDGLVKVDGWQDMEVTDAAQAVQRSAFPEAYAQHERLARAWASALTGNSPGAITCTLRPVADDGPAGASAATGLTDLLMRDLGLPQDDGGSRIGGPRDDGAVPVDVDATALPYDDPDRAAWAVAHWAVATAATTGAVEVRVADQVWTRDSAAWTTLPADRDPRPAGQVRVLVGPDPS
ncbi:hypothetical protein ATJ88_1155 [Isoptericola jiangsuensis]|uniref:Uncharacterized protein n=1 Tax=Isoptericola jiangsuensis TaxID=548579 RepID=A0A2A9EUS0_9MICO|nr:hypothetical protein [Isoptericola jiangsuensis]PFG42493.1 hypothetical protein ATJ88_1155 [Isoptericola jiangsuensis]